MPRVAPLEIADLLSGIWPSHYNVESVNSALYHGQGVLEALRECPLVESVRVLPTWGIPFLVRLKNGVKLFVASNAMKASRYHICRSKFTSKVKRLRRTFKDAPRGVSLHILLNPYLRQCCRSFLKRTLGVIVLNTWHKPRERADIPLVKNSVAKVIRSLLERIINVSRRTEDPVDLEDLVELGIGLRELSSYLGSRVRGLAFSITRKVWILLRTIRPRYGGKPLDIETSLYGLLEPRRYSGLCLSAYAITVKERPAIPERPTL